MTVQDTERPVGPPDPDPARSASRAGSRPDLGGLRPLLMRLHFYAGLLVGPFVLVAAFTGLLYTVSPQLERAVHAHELTVPVGAAPPVALSQQVAAAQRALPEGTLIEVRPAATPDATTRVSFDAPGVREDYQRTAFVDPYTGEVRGVLDTFGEWLPARAWLDELHRTLLLGDVGRVYSELAASWLWVLALSGVVIWTVRRRRDRRLRRVLLPETRPGGRGRLRSWHATVGLWALAGMLLLSATGLTWSQFAGANVGTLRSALNWSTPSVSTTLPPGAGAAGAGVAGTGADAGAGAGGGEAVTAERMLDVARASGMGGPVEIRPPGEPNGAWAVQQVQRHWPSQQDAVAIDPSTGTIVEQIRFADWPLAAKLARWGIDTHMGLLFGVANQVLLAALALGICCMIVWAYRMWWLRRPTRGAVAGPPGAAARPGRGAVLLIGLVAVGVGVFLPVLGASLLIFLILDSIVVSRRPGLGALQGRPTPAGSAADDGQPSRRDSGGTVGRC